MRKMKRFVRISSESFCAIPNEAERRGGGAQRVKAENESSALAVRESQKYIGSVTMNSGRRGKKG